MNATLMCRKLQNDLFEQDRRLKMYVPKYHVKTSNHTQGFLLKLYIHVIFLDTIVQL